MIWPEFEDPLFMNDNIIDITATLQRHRTRTYPQRNMSVVSQLICHSSGTLNGSPESFARYHVNNLGWAGIGYHVVFDMKKIWLTQHFNRTTNHCSGQNTRSIGICMIGDFDRQPATPEVYKRYAEVILLVETLTNKKYNVKLHRDFTNKKSCPGRNFKLDQLKTHI